MNTLRKSEYEIKKTFMKSAFALTQKIIYCCKSVKTIADINNAVKQWKRYLHNIIIMIVSYLISFYLSNNKYLIGFQHMMQLGNLNALINEIDGKREKPQIYLFSNSKINIEGTKYTKSIIKWRQTEETDQFTDKYIKK